MTRISLLCAGYTAPVALAAVRELWRGQDWCHCWALTGICSSLAGIVLVCRQHWPERWYPDVPVLHVLNSHALMHLLVLAEYVCEWLLLNSLHRHPGLELWQ